MPQRTNFFQRVVTEVYRAASGTAELRESELLVDRVTGDQREVDVVIRAKVANHEIILSIEAADRSRPATIEWVEQVIAKHHSLPTNKLVLVANAGFTRSARLRADAEGVLALQPEDLDAEERISSFLIDLFASGMSFRRVSHVVIGARAYVSVDDGGFVLVDGETPLFEPDGSAIGAIEPLLLALVDRHAQKMAAGRGLLTAGADQTVDFALEIAELPTYSNRRGEDVAFCLRLEGERVVQITRLVIYGTLTLTLGRTVDAPTKRLNEITYVASDLEAEGSGGSAQIVLTEDGERRGTAAYYAGEGEKSALLVRGDESVLLSFHAEEDERVGRGRLVGRPPSRPAE